MNFKLVSIFAISLFIIVGCSNDFQPDLSIEYINKTANSNLISIDDNHARVNFELELSNNFDADSSIYSTFDEILDICKIISKNNLTDSEILKFKIISTDDSKSEILLADISLSDLETINFDKIYAPEFSKLMDIRVLNIGLRKDLEPDGDFKHLKSGSYTPQPEVGDSSTVETNTQNIVDDSFICNPILLPNFTNEYDTQSVIDYLSNSIDSGPNIEYVSTDDPDLDGLIESQYPVAGTKICSCIGPESCNDKTVNITVYQFEGDYLLEPNDI